MYIGFPCISRLFVYSPSPGLLSLCKPCTCLYNETEGLRIVRALLSQSLFCHRSRPREDMCLLYPISICRGRRHDAGSWPRRLILRLREREELLPPRHLEAVDVVALPSPPVTVPAPQPRPALVGKVEVRKNVVVVEEKVGCCLDLGREGMSEGEREDGRQRWRERSGCLEKPKFVLYT